LAVGEALHPCSLAFPADVRNQGVAVVRTSQARHGSFRMLGAEKADCPISTRSRIFRATPLPKPAVPLSGGKPAGRLSLQSQSFRLALASPESGHSFMDRIERCRWLDYRCSMQMVDKRSPYAAGWRLMVRLIIALPLLVWGVPLVLVSAGVGGDNVVFIALPFALVWFLIGSIGSFLIACPKCGRSVFIRRFGFSAPWPARNCSKCRQDLTE
jgi:hypothetical protein